MCERLSVKTGVLAALLFVLPALPVAAQTGADGTLSLRWLQDDPLRSEAYFGDFSLRAARGPWEGTVGFFGVVGRLHETYADINYQTGQTRLTFGFPRPAYDQVVPAALTQIMPRLALDTIGTSRSRATQGTMNERKYLPYGVSLTHESGSLRYLASVHRVPDYKVTIAGAGVSGENGPWRGGVAVEAVDQNGALDWNGKAQASYGVGGWRLGAGLYLPDANATSDMVEVFASHAAFPRATVTVLSRFSRKAEPILALGADLALSDTVDLEIGLAAASDQQTALEFGVAFNF